MDIRDYLRMLKRGWPIVLITAVIFVGLSSLYLTLTPKQYQSTAVILVSASDPTSIVDLAQGNQFLTNSVSGYAQIIDSVAVLGPVGSSLRPQRRVDDLVAMVSAVVRPQTTLIDITATGADPQDVLVVASAVAASAARVIPSLEKAADGSPLVRVQQIRPAVEPSQAVSPNVNRVLVLGLVAGLLIGLATTIAMQALDTRIRRAHDLRMLTELPVLGVLPKSRRALNRRVVIRDDSAGASGEAYRALRTNIRFLDSKAKRSLLFASVADNSEGAQVPANLAWSLAEAGHRVLLIDLDLRQSNVGYAVGIDTNVGMADVLAGIVHLPAALQRTDHPNLSIVLSGGTVPNPSELLTSPTMSATLRQMESDYDYVVAHAPPLLSYTDAAVLAGVVGGTLVSVTVGHTGAQELNTALMVLGNVGVSPMGLVLTRAGRAASEHRRARGSVKGRSGLLWRRFQWDWGRTYKPKAIKRHSVR